MPNLQAPLAAPLPVASGGTGVATATAAGGVVYTASTTAYGTTAAGTSGQFLQSAGAGAPTWSSTYTGAVNGTTIAGTTGTFSGLLTVGSGRPITVDGSVGAINIQGSAGGWGDQYGFKGSAGTALGGFGALGSADTLAYYYIGTYPTQVATFTQGTGVAVTGTLAVSSTINSQTISSAANFTGSLAVATTLTAATLTLTNDLAVAQGGTGVSTAPAAGSVIYGVSTTAHGATAAGTAGQALTSGGTGVPVWKDTTPIHVAVNASPPGSPATNDLWLVTDAAPASNKWTAAANAAPPSSPATNDLWLVTDAGASLMPTYTDGGILHGDGTSAIQVTAAGNATQLLASTGTGVPIWSGDTSWTVPTLGNSWATYGAGWEGPGFMLDSMGFVHLRGLIKSGTVATTVFTLPAGYRPINGHIFSGIAGVGGCRIDVASSGTVTIQQYFGSGTNASVSLGGITFPVI